VGNHFEIQFINQPSTETITTQPAINDVRTYIFRNFTPSERNVLSP